MVGARNETAHIEEALESLKLRVDRRLILAERGLVHTADTEDRRIIHLSITAEGAVVAKEAQQIQNDCGRALLEGLTGEQRQQMETLWEILLDNGERLAGEVGR